MDNSEFCGVGTAFRRQQAYVLVLGTGWPFLPPSPFAQKTSLIQNHLSSSEEEDFLCDFYQREGEEKS